MPYVRWGAFPDVGHAPICCARRGRLRQNVPRQYVPRQSAPLVRPGRAHILCVTISHSPRTPHDLDGCGFIQPDHRAPGGRVSRFKWSTDQTPSLPSSFFAGSVHMIEIARIILRGLLHALLWGSELIAASLLLAWLYYVIALEPRIRRQKKTMPAAGSNQPTPPPTDHREP